MRQSSYRPFAKTLYPIGPLMALASVADPMMRIFPLQLSNMTWRFGAVGLLSEGVVGVVFGVACTIGIAMLLDHRRTARVLSVVAMLTGILMAVVLAFFLLDALQLRADVQPQLKAAFDASVAKAALMIAVACPIPFAMGIAGWRTTSRPRDAVATARQAPAVMLNRQAKEVFTADAQVAH